jgi:hypothetical protein
METVDVSLGGGLFFVKQNDLDYKKNKLKLEQSFSERMGLYMS